MVFGVTTPAPEWEPRNWNGINCVYFYSSSNAIHNYNSKYATPLQKFLDKDNKSTGSKPESDKLESNEEATETAVEPSAEKPGSEESAAAFKAPPPFSASGGGRLGKLGRFVPLRMRGNY